ncbi:MAG: F0F1 ATP synthase subunit C [Candidatus Hydrogenedentes bacterium]|nr:F0F1 ATP synthase subunit C [Candidatus Hydrogenedentota bacterium]
MLAVGPLFIPAHAQEGGAEGTTAIEKDRQAGSVGYGLRALGLAVGAGIAIAGAGLGTGRAQASVGAGGTGAITEKPELFGNVLLLFAIPETIVVFGFVIAIMLLMRI